MPHPRLKRAFEQNEAQLTQLAPRWGCADASEVFNLSASLTCAAESMELCAPIPALWNEFREHSDWHRIALTRSANKAEPTACEQMLKVLARDPKTKKAACAALPEVISFFLEERLTDDENGIWKLVDYCKADKDYAKSVKICATQGLQVTHGVAQRLASRLAYQVGKLRQPE